MVGALQRGIGYIGFKILKKRATVPATLDKYLRAVKYIILTGFAVLSIASGKFLLQVSVDDVFEQYSIILPGLAWISIMLMFVTIIGSFFIDNFFCKYICIQVLSPELQVGLAPVVSSDAKISASIASYVQRTVPQI
ncbi:hypothetical protein [Methanosarcina horonobensis]|uniref:hypothetical protein n=1 Tax=Methanosarcina horonobensis TaxID=418008 RepID=UPI000A84A62F|nr:hypothetical protein [Methanosarcina horonobensis]